MKSPSYRHRLSALLLHVVGASFAPTGAAAHDGHHLSHILADVAAVEAHGKIVGLELVLANQSQHRVTLKDILAPAAETAPMAPLHIAPGEAQRVEVTLFFESNVPGIFTAVLDFGAAGQGPVLITNEEMP